MSLTFPFIEDEVVELFSATPLENRSIFYKIKRSGEDYILTAQASSPGTPPHLLVKATKNSREKLTSYCHTENLCLLIDCRSSGDNEEYLIRLTVKKFVDKVLQHNIINISYNRQVVEQSWKLLNLNQQEDEKGFIKVLDSELTFSLKGKTLLYCISSNSPSGKRSITFIGKTVNVTVEESNGLFVIKRIFRNSGNNSPLCYILTEEFRVSNFAAGKVNKRLLDDLKGESDYLTTWKEYLKYEIKKLSDYSKVKYANKRVNEDNYTCFSLSVNLNPAEWKLIDTEKEETFFITSHSPEPLSYRAEEEVDPLESFKQWESQWSKWNEKYKKSKTTVGLKKINRANNSIVIALKSEQELPEQGWLIRDMIGEMTRLKRHCQALENLQTGRSKIPHLIALIENRKLSGLTKGMLTLSQSVRKKVFPGNKPNESQITSILLALNTPDIVLIQGPPGTGKTTVARAIAERTGELLDNARMSVLFAAYQHDAVKNILERTEINGFPVLKLGKKQEEKEEWESTIAGWINGIKKHLTLFCKENPVNFSYDKVIKYITGYLKTPLNANALNKYLQNLYKIYPHKNIDELREKLAAQSRAPAETLNKEYMLYAIRTTKAGILDDGRVNLALLKGEEWLEKRDRERVAHLLEKKVESEEEIDEDYINSCLALKAELLDKYKKGKSIRAPQPNQDVIKLLEKLKIELDRKRKEEYKKEHVIHELLTEFNSDPYALEEAVLDYAVGIGSTTGQAVSNKSISRLTIGGDTPDEYTFNTTIIDEAARATPLDLFGAMNITKGRIVLVGDHRQLPHIYDQEIEKEIEAGHQTIDEEEYLKKSFFQFMFELLKEREKVDGIKRAVTLNRQYRMHETLGNFVSQTFYDHYGEGFSSPRGVDGFKRFARYDNKPLAWLNIPNNMEAEKRNPKGSFERNIEIDIIIKDVKKLKSISSDIEIGIITFYRGQADLIEKKVKDNFPNEAGIKAGTVDSFQGMEFDVVFLSTVRSNRRAKFGFLTVTNRLCVAMSRQKSLLVVVGDRDMIDNYPNSTEHPVQALFEFSRLCAERGYNE